MNDAEGEEVGQTETDSASGAIVLHASSSTGDRGTSNNNVGGGYRSKFNFSSGYNKKYSEENTVVPVCTKGKE